jgi:Zn-dependent M16 (insulinase) family peptidase
LDPDLVEMALTQIELNSKMPKTDFGTTLLSNMITILMTSDKANQMNGLEFLKVSENIEKIRRNLKKRQQIFEPLIKNTFLNNPHYIRVMMKSDQNFVSGYIEQEKNLLEITQKNMSPEELKKVELDVK